MSAGQAVHSPVIVDLYLPAAIFPLVGVHAVVDEISLYAGAAVGTASVRFPHQYALNAQVTMGMPCRIQILDRVIFRGVIGQAPYRIHEGDQGDEVALFLYDDKWRLRARTIGQPGIGTVPAAPPEEVGDEGFSDVGFDTVFNPDGIPNKAPAALDFHSGSSAVQWTLKSMLEWVFEYYVNEDAATLNPALLSVNYDLVPSHVDLTGMPALEAIDAICKLAGESWTLLPGTDASAFRPVRAGAGTVRSVKLFPPRGGAQASTASGLHPSEIEIGGSIQDYADRFVAVSANSAMEQVYSNVGADPLLILSTPTDPKYSYRWAVDVTAYEANGLGRDLSAGSRPKAWLPHLLSRPNAAVDGYLTALEMEAPFARQRPAVPAPVLWMSPYSTAIADARLVVSGYALDLDAGTVDMEPKVVLATADQEENETIGTPFPAPSLWLTVATRLETRQSATADNDARLPDEERVVRIIRKNELVPELRGNPVLPTPGSDNRNAWMQILADDTYVNWTTALQAAADAAAIAADDLETPISMRFPLFPTLDIGDRISISGRTHSASADAVVTEIVYRVHEAYEIRVRATNAVGNLDPDNFERAA